MLTKDLNKQLYKTTLGTDNDEVIIGDPKSATFKPEITFTKWRNIQTGIPENSITIKPSGQLALDLADATPTLTSGKLEIRKGKVGWYANPDPDNENNFKFGLILYEKPSTNTWSFQIEGWEEYNFDYQPPLTEEWKIGDFRGRIVSITETDCFDKDGNSIVHRPENVVGGYAIYHKTKKNHILGQQNYKTGQFGIWYRPRFLDSLGNWIYGTLDIKNGVVVETCPQEFLEQADRLNSYPVKSNATFGYLTHGSSYISEDPSWTGEAGLDELSPAGTNTLNYITWYTGGSGSADADAKFGLYSDTSGDAVTLLCSDTTAFDMGGADAEYTNTVDYNYSLAASTQYHAAILFLVQGGHYWYNSGGSKNLTGTASDLPSPWDGGGYASNIHISVYCTYTPSGGGAAGVDIHQLIMCN